uniref:Rho-GAP domain-containing protein n=1 Tax=Equus caballus TaxID=9796 RepID=A0A9L0SQM1_HORSE
MLFFINQKGPLTEGIFRKSANMKSCRALKETLNAGDKVTLDCESVLVVASVLKDFLGNIPGSVFTSHLHEKWLTITDGENEEEKIAATQRLLAKLPRANAALLRYLFGVLHNIQQHSSVNQLTAYNLATCIAPSILCLPNACSAELASDITRKIFLVQFLIENCLQILGEDIASLLLDSATHCDGSEKAADPVNNSTVSATIPWVPHTNQHSKVRGLGLSIGFSALSPVLTTVPGTNSSSIGIR